MQFKARPVGAGVGKQFELKASAKALTEPMSPALATKGRVRVQQHDENDQGVMNA
jgi:hypothetical protein